MMYDVINMILVGLIGCVCFVMGYVCGGDDAERSRNDVKRSGCRISDRELWDKYMDFKKGETK